MNVIQTFDKWFNGLTPEAQTSLVNHILSSTRFIALEGVDVGPVGQLMTKGLFAGPPGHATAKKCPTCGK